MRYIYAYSNHKTGLSRLRRMAVEYKRLTDSGVEVTMMTNDHRAANAIRDYGVPACVTIETMWDIDMIAQRGDTLLLDTPEDDGGKLELYVEMFSDVVRVAQSCDDVSKYGEKVLHLDPEVDIGFKNASNLPKIDREVLFFGDSDPDKLLLDMDGDGLELLLGEYFYVGYDDELRDIFGLLHEAEEYKDILSSSQKIQTYDAQAAYEANAAGAQVLFFCHDIEKCQHELMSSLGIKVIIK